MSQLPGNSDVLYLGRFVAASEQDDQHVPFLDELDAVTRAVVDAQFGDAFTDRFDIARIPEGQTPDADVDARLGLTVPK